MILRSQETRSSLDKNYLAALLGMVLVLEIFWLTFLAVSYLRGSSILMSPVTALPVVNDYHKRIAKGWAEAREVVRAAVEKLSSGASQTISTASLPAALLRRSTRLLPTSSAQPSLEGSPSLKTASSNASSESFVVRLLLLPQ
jgi:hypothetical protein